MLVDVASVHNPAVVFALLNLVEIAVRTAVADWYYLMLKILQDIANLLF